MAGKTHWTSYSDVNKHPGDSLLLAYLRKQQLEDGLNISQHIDVEKCSSCIQKLNELKQVSTTLDVLGEMRSYQHYPELSVADTYARMQSTANRQILAKTAMKGVNHRQRPRKSAVRWISLPAAFGLTILFMVAMLVFANLSGKSLIPRSLNGGTSATQTILTVVVPPHSTLAPDLTATVSAGGSATPVPMPTTTHVTGPYIEICSTPINITRWRLVICGHNFEAGYKVTLVALGNVPVWLPNLPVDKQGDFKVGWNIVNCSNLPTTIYSYEVTNSKPIYIKLQITSFGSCSASTTTPIVGPSGLSPNYGK
ncbi:MAG TPA: hypothetical protein VIX20_13685 [Ktedonobacteraceae bacterium]